MKKIYIIGNIPETIDQKTIENFYLTEMKLNKMKFTVINPLKRFLNNQQTHETSKRKNIHDLMFAEAVYIMPCVNLKNENIEVKIAFKFNLCIFSGTLDLVPTKKEIKLLKLKKNRFNLI